MQLNDYGGQVFVPLIMVALLAPLYRLLKKIFPENVQMVFVPFLSMAIMIPSPPSCSARSASGSATAWVAASRGSTPTRPSSSRSSFR
jgi:hypothetical protein